jgi:hypothetical protein
MSMVFQRSYVAVRAWLGLNLYLKGGRTMRKAFILLTPVVLLTFLFSAVPCAFSQKPIIIGAPLSTAFLYGWGAQRGIILAVEEINAQGGGRCGWKEAAAES